MLLHLYKSVIEKKPGAKKVLINIYSRTKLSKNLEKRIRRKGISLRSIMLHPWRAMKCPIAKKQHLATDKGGMFLYSKDRSFYSVSYAAPEKEERKRASTP